MLGYRANHSGSDASSGPCAESQGTAHPIQPCGVAVLRKERIHLKNQSCHVGAQARQGFPVKTAFRQEIKLVTPDIVCGGICWAWNLGLSVRGIKMWAFSAKSLTGMSPSQRDSSARQQPGLCREQGWSCWDLLTFFSAFLPGGVQGLSPLCEPPLPQQLLLCVCPNSPCLSTSEMRFFQGLCQLPLE